MRFLLTCLLLMLAPPAWAAPDAEALIRAGRVAEALPVARAEAEAAPGDVAAQERYIDLLLTVGAQAAAETVYRQRAESEDDADSWYLLGRAVRTAAEAEAAYDAALAKAPGHARAHMGLGAVRRAQGDFEAAITAYTRALELDPTLGEAWAGLAAAHLSRGESEAALAAARQGMVNVPDQADSYIAVSVLAPDEAEAVLKKAAARIEGDPRIHAALAEVHLDEGDGASAKSEADRALAIDPSRNDARLSLMFARSMAAGTLDAEGYRGLLEARALEGRDGPAARAAYDRLVAAHPGSPLPWMGRARLRAEDGNVEGALADLGKALEADPSAIEAMASMGLLLLESGRASEARPLLARAAEERPQDASLGLAHAASRKATGDTAGALETLARVQAAHPYDARLILTHSKWLAEDGKSQQAYEVLKEAVKRLPGDDRLVLGLAAAAKDIGRPEEAADLLDVLAERSGNPDLKELARKLRAGEL